MIKLKYNQLIISLLFLAIFGCKKMDDTYKDFIKDGETVYISKPDSLVAFVGRDRVQLQWLLISDPKVKSYKVYWNNRADSIEGTVTKTNNVDTVRVMINNLPEGTYNFEVFQFDSYGNSSIKSSVVGRSYGSLYEGNLYNRLTSSIKRNGDKVELTFSPKDEFMRAVEVSYLDVNNSIRKIVYSGSSNVIELMDFPMGGEFNYKTLYAPDSLYVDLFSTSADFFEEVITEVQTDKSKFAHYPLPTDTHQPLYYNWGVPNLWDGITDQPDKFFYMNPDIPGLQLPSWFTVDLGGEKLLSKVRVNQLSHVYPMSWLYKEGAPKTYEIYGSNNPSPDGSFTNWDLLGSFTSIKPATDSEVLAQGLAGELQLFENNSNKYRYVRFKTTSTWGGHKNVMISELTFYDIGSAFRRVIK